MFLKLASVRTLLFSSCWLLLAAGWWLAGWWLAAGYTHAGCWVLLLGALCWLLAAAEYSTSPGCCMTVHGGCWLLLPAGWLLAGWSLAGCWVLGTGCCWVLGAGCVLLLLSTWLPQVCRWGDVVRLW